jgi:hypothetical protein
MIRSSRRRIATVMLPLILAQTASGCMSVQRTQYNPDASLGKITGVTTRSGTKIPFTSPGASITNDTLYAMGRQGQIMIPADSVAQIWNDKFSKGRTAGLVVGLGVGVAAALLIAVAASFGHESFFTAQ